MDAVSKVSDCSGQEEPTDDLTFVAAIIFRISYNLVMEDCRIPTVEPGPRIDVIIHVYARDTSRCHNLHTSTDCRNYCTLEGVSILIIIYKCLCLPEP